MAPTVQILIGLALMLLTLFMHLMAITMSLGRIKVAIELVYRLGTGLDKVVLVLGQTVFLSLVFLIEAMVWALAFVGLDVINGFWQAVYFSIVTLTTLGYGDLTPDADSQLIAAFCAITGLLLVGLSTAFVVEILRRLEFEDDERTG